MFLCLQVDVLTSTFDCLCYFHSDWALTAYVTWAALAIYFVPILTLIGAYSQICVAVWRSEGFKRQARATATFSSFSTSTSCIQTTYTATKSDRSTTEKQPRNVRLAVTYDVSWRDPVISTGAGHHSPTSADSSSSNPRVNLPLTSRQPSAVFRQLPSSTCNDAACRSGLETSELTSMPAVTTIATPSGGGRQRVSSAKLKTVKLTLIVVASYIACYGPYFVIQLWAAWDNNAPYQGLCLPRTLINI